jgi:hypothetical protein
MSGHVPNDHLPGIVIPEEINAQAVPLVGMLSRKIKMLDQKVKQTSDHFPTMEPWEGAWNAWQRRRVPAELQ